MVHPFTVPYRLLPSFTVQFSSRDERDSQPARPPRRLVTNPSFIRQTSPAERSVRYGSRGPSRASRPDRAKNTTPHRVTGTGWGERASRTRNGPLAVCSRAGQTCVRVGSERESTDVRLRDHLKTQGRQHDFYLPENKNRVTVATPRAAIAGRDSLEARGTLKTSSQTVKADSKVQRGVRP